MDGEAWKARGRRSGPPTWYPWAGASPRNQTTMAGGETSRWGRWAPQLVSSPSLGAAHLAGARAAHLDRCRRPAARGLTAEQVGLDAGPRGNPPPGDIAGVVPRMGPDVWSRGRVEGCRERDFFKRRLTRGGRWPSW